MSVMAPKIRRNYYKPKAVKKCIVCPALFRGKGERCKPCQADYRDEVARVKRIEKAKLKKNI